MLVVSKQHQMKQQIIDTLKKCGLQESDFKAHQKMEHDDSYIPTKTKTVFGPIMIEVLNLPAVIEHSEEIGKIYRVNFLTLNDQPVFASIEHENGIGVHRHPIEGKSE